ncbi:MAG: CBS domain-containing protein [Thermomicrobiales bacterium]
MRAIDIMECDVISVPSGTGLPVATRLLLDHRINAMPVMGREGNVAGMIGIRDILCVPLSSHNDTPILLWDSLEEKVQHLRDLTVDHVMTRRNLVSVPPQASVIEVASIMANRGVHPLLVMTGGELLGVIGRANIARFLLALATEEPGGTHPSQAVGTA